MTSPAPRPFKLGCAFWPRLGRDYVDEAHFVEGEIGRAFGMVRVYSNVTGPGQLIPRYAQILAKEGRKLLVSFHLPGFTWAQVAAGKADHLLEIIENEIRAFCDFGYRPYVCFHHEPDSAKNASYGGPADFVAAWHRIRHMAVPTARWVWIITGWDPRKIALFYPGDDVVDVVGTDAYNWAFSEYNPTAKWISLEQACQTFLTWGPRGKPRLIGEFGCCEDPDQAGRKANWLVQAGAFLKANFIAACYFNAPVGGEWWLDSTVPSIEGFKAMAGELA